MVDKVDSSDLHCSLLLARFSFCLFVFILFYSFLKMKM